MIVAQTDGIVFCMNSDVVKRLCRANLQRNIYGWGIDQMAVAFAYANGMIAVVDESFFVRHPKSRGYPSDVAGVQWREFLDQLTMHEQIQHRLLFSYFREKNNSVKHITSKSNQSDATK